MENVFLTPENVKVSFTNTPQITFEITDACNLECVYCNYGNFYYDHDPRTNKNMPTAYAYRLIDYLYSLWHSEYNSSYNKNVYMSFYGGEPLLNFKFITQIVEYIEKLDNPNRIFTYSMTTNGVLLNKYMDYLVEKNFSLLISLDGDKDNSAYRIDKSRRPAFERVVANIDELQKKYPIFFKKNVNFNAVLHNKNTVESIHSFFMDKYQKIAAITELNNVGIRPEKKEDFWRMYRSTFQSLVQSSNYSQIEKERFVSSPTYNSAALFLLKYSDFVYNDYNDLLFGKTCGGKTCPTGTCIPFSRRIFLTVNGKVMPCEKIGQHFFLGKITEQDVSINFQRIADLYNSFYAKLATQCASCYNTKACIQCMFNLSSIESEKVICHGFMNKQDFEVYKKSQMDFFKKNPEAYEKIMKEVIYQ